MLHKKFVQILKHFDVYGQPIVKSLLRILWRHCICWLICWGSSCADCAWSGDLLKLICCLEAQIVLHNVLGQAIPIWCYRSLHSCAWHGMAWHGTYCVHCSSQSAEAGDPHLTPHPAIPDQPQQPIEDITILCGHNNSTERSQLIK